MNAKKKADDSSGRFNTSHEVKLLVWIRAAGHCELCGTDLTHDFRIGTPMIIKRFAARAKSYGQERCLLIAH